MRQPLTLYTIGHSTRTFDEFVELLHAHGVHAIADVRLIPRSRRVPQFNDDALKTNLPKSGIEYLPMKALGGRRRAHKDSINTGWRNESFRGYADFTQTADFEAALDALIHVARDRPTAIMCAEAVPWRCHRSLIADAMLVRGWTVLDITGPGKPKRHALTPFAKVEGTRITYPDPVEPEPPAPLFSASP
jgi:uncharacterized protein (DUF488 family)